MIVWITGLSGVGKTTLARRIVAELRLQGRVVVLLDGDQIREAIGQAGYDSESRLRNGQRISRLAQLIRGEGPWVVVSTVSLFREIHRWNRRNLPGYLEVYVNADLDELRARDSKGVYGGGMAVGVDLGFDVPEAPDLVIDNDFRQQTLRDAVGRILALTGGPSCEIR